MEKVEHLKNVQIKHIPIKRTFDIIFSLLCLILGLPLFILIALLIFCTSPGKVFFAHERIGRGGKPFRCYKFRSMYPDADKRLKDILDNDPLIRKEWEASYKLKKDPRIIPIGALLRKTSLDELPQFWNVLKGDLSIVGPRPVIKAEVEQHFGVKAYKILSIRPGLTGLWQVSGRSDIASYQKRVELDEYYVDHRSLSLDLKLIAKTVPAMLFSKGAY
ncbi:MAG: sugar transferase [Parachlamydia sp.]|nr:sugar transferase [Parachlamydia sp.]